MTGPKKSASPVGTRPGSKPEPKPGPKKSAIPSPEKKREKSSASVWTPERVAAFFETLKTERPDPRTELDFTNPFTLLAAVALSAQATDKSVNQATRGLFAAADNPAAMLALGEDRIGDYIRTIGLWRNKARNLVAMSALLIERHGGEVPHDRAALETLPGIGRKTANVVLNEAFGEATIAVDTHIFRVANRTGLAPGANPLKVELELLKVIPPAYAKGAHHWLILHGRYTCLARRPRCRECVIRDYCAFESKEIDGRG